MFLQLIRKFEFVRFFHFVENDFSLIYIYIHRMNYIFESGKLKKKKKNY